MLAYPTIPPHPQRAVFGLLTGVLLNGFGTHKGETPAVAEVSGPHQRIERV